MFQEYVTKHKETYCPMIVVDSLYIYYYYHYITYLYNIIYYHNTTAFLGVSNG